MNRGVRAALAFAIPALLAGLMVAGLATAAPAKKSNKPRVPAGDTSAVIAVVAGEAITRAMVERRLDDVPDQYRANFTTPAGRQQLIDRMIEERIWLMQADRAGVAERPEVKSQLEQQRRDLLVRTYLNEKMAENPGVSDSVTRAYYDDHIEDYRTPATVTLQHILLRSERDAKRVRQRAERGEEWAKLVKKHSRDSLTLTSEGSLGTVTKTGVFASIGAQPALAESAMALGRGAIGGPYRTDKGWHVIRVGSVNPEGLRTFDQMRSIIVRQLQQQSSQTYYREVLDRAREDLGVTVDSAAAEGFVSQRKSAREMFQEAQALTAPAARLTAYAQVVEAHPDSAVSPQAQFMLGFINSEELKNYDAAEVAFQELLRRYPDSELAESARWMLKHMRTKDAPDFQDVEGDSLGVASTPGAGEQRSDTP